MFYANNKCRPSPAMIPIRHERRPGQSKPLNLFFLRSASFPIEISSITLGGANEAPLEGFVTTVFIRLNRFAGSLSIFLWYLL